MPSYPYISSLGPLTQAFTQLRSAMPPKVNVGYLRRFNIAPGSESSVISILRFLSILDEGGNRIDNNDYLYGNEDFPIRP